VKDQILPLNQYDGRALQHNERALQREQALQHDEQVLHTKEGIKKRIQYEKLNKTYNRIKIIYEQ
jgi:hypothetical protein